jgi:hypothetical protein
MLSRTRASIVAMLVAVCVLASGTSARAEIQGKSEVYWFDGVTTDGVVTCKMWYQPTVYPSTPAAGERTVVLNGWIQCSPNGLSAANLSLIAYDSTDTNSKVVGGQSQLGGKYFECGDPFDGTCGTPAKSFDFTYNQVVPDGRYVQYNLKKVSLALFAKKHYNGGIQDEEGMWVDAPEKHGCIPEGWWISCTIDFVAYDPEQFPEDDIPEW